MKIKMLFNFAIGICGELAFLYGILMHGSMMGQVYETLGIVLVSIAIILVAKLGDVK